VRILFAAVSTDDRDEKPNPERIEVIYWRRLLRVTIDFDRVLGTKESMPEKGDAETSLIFISPRFSMTRNASSVIPNQVLNLFQDLTNSGSRFSLII
jgi:hypothetical protein